MTWQGQAQLSGSGRQRSGTGLAVVAAIVCQNVLESRLWRVLVTMTWQGQAQLRWFWTAASGAGLAVVAAIVCQNVL